jgi:hypothetical protein
MAKYRKRPVVIEAVQFDPAVQPWPEGVHAMVGPWAATESHARACSERIAYVVPGIPHEGEMRLCDRHAHDLGLDVPAFRRREKLSPGRTEKP